MTTIKFSVNYKFKKRVLLHFASVFNTKATLKAVKAMFPYFDARKLECWEALVEYCEDTLEAREVKKLSAPEEIEQQAKSFNCDLSSPQSFLGYSYVVNRNRDYLGTVGFSTTKNSWYCNLGRHGRQFLTSSCSEAFTTLLKYRGFASSLNVA